MIKLFMKLIPLGVTGFIGYNGYQQVLDFGATAISSVEINMTKHELSNFISMIAIEHQIGHGFPSDFRSFLEEHFQKPDGSFKEIWEDVWLNDYNYSRHKRGCRISSNGPDSSAGTKDDIVRSYGNY
ncbi:MAG: hypothetical protein ABIA63_14245 [bacterium]